MSEKLPEKASENMSDRMPDKMPKRMPAEMSKRICESECAIESQKRMADKMSEHICPLGHQMKGWNLCQMQCQNTDSRWAHYVRENAGKKMEIRQVECRKICQIYSTSEHMPEYISNSMTEYMSNKMLNKMMPDKMQM